MTDNQDKQVNEEAVSEPTASDSAVDAPEEQQEADAQTAKAAEASDAPVAEADDDTSAVEESSSEEATSEETTSEEADTKEPSAEAVSAGEEGDSDSVEENKDEESKDDEDSDNSDKVVKMLAVGQQVEGKVRRLTDFGAFVDIGVGRDGLIHISELSLQRVGKVSDVLSKNQEVKPWIKKLDRERNRISLTLIDPDTKTIKDLQENEIVTGTVTRILPYGAFVDIGIGRDALLHVREMSNKYVEKPEEIVSAGEEIEVRVIEVSRRRGRVDLSLKGLRDEPEDEAVAEQMAEDEEMEEIVDEFEEVEVLSPMELAFKKAVEAEGGEVNVEKQTGKKKRGKRSSAIQDEIIARTLGTARK